MGYSDSEIRATSEKLLLSAIRRPLDSLGSRDTVATFNDLQEAAAGVYVLFYLAPFYTIYLGARRLLDDLQAAQTATSELITLTDILRRNVLPVKDISSLVNAKVALFELEAAVTRSPPTDLTRVPAYVRFNQNVDRFLLQASAIKQQGQIVSTPQEARQRIPSMLLAFGELLQTIAARAAYLEDALDNFNSVGLPKLVATSVVAKSRLLVEQRADQMATLSETDRLEVLRETVLDLLGTKAAVTKFGSPAPSSSFALSGTAAAYADSAYPANPAVLTSANSGPFITLSSATPADNTYRLALWLDGLVPPAAPPAVQIPAPSEVLYFPISFYARAEGIVEEPFDVVANTNDTLVLDSDGLLVTITLTAGVGRTCLQVCADINAAFVAAYLPAASPFVAEPYYAPLKFDGLVNVTAPNQIDLVTGEPFPLDPSTGQSYLQVGDTLTFYSSTNTGTYTISAITPSLANPRHLIVLPATLATHSSELIQVGSALRRIRIVPRDKAASCLAKQYIQVKTPTTLARSTAMTFGYYGEIISTSAPTDLSVLADFINTSSQKVSGSTLAVLSHADIQLRTEPSSALRLIAFYWRGSCSHGAGGPGLLTVNLSSPPSDTTNLLGSALVLRSGYTPSAQGVIASVGVPAAGVLPVQVNFTTAVSAETGVLAEIGPSSGIAADMKVTVATGINSGSYYVGTVSAVPFDFTTRDPLPSFRDGYNQPEFMRADIGQEYLTISSANRTLTSAVAVRDDTGLLFPTVGPHTFHGTTRYLQLPSTPADLAPGAVLSYYTVSTTTPLWTATIVKVLTANVVELDVDLAYNFSASFGTALPYLRLYREKAMNFDAFKSRLLAWLSSPTFSDVTSYLVDLNRYMNPLLQNTNPPATAVMAAVSRLQDSLVLLFEAEATRQGQSTTGTLENILASYYVDPVVEVDALIRSFTERGADRALTMLLQGRFVDFFGLDKDDVSYAGTFQKTLRELAKEHLPVSKTDRYDQTTSPRVSTADSPNYEYDSSDLDTTSNPDLPDM